MLLKFRSLFFSLIFMAGLELTIFRPGWVLYISLTLFLISFFEGRQLGHRWSFSILPIFFTLSSIGLLYLISFPAQEQTFILLSSLMYYLSLFGAYRLGEYQGDQTARGMLMAATLATIFFSYAGIYGIYLNILVPLYALMFSVLLVTLLVSYQYFSLIELDKFRLWSYSFLLALIMAELFWTINFWPFGYLATGVIALIFYYILWDLIPSYFLNSLSKPRVIGNLIFFSGMIFLVLMSAKWIPTI
jgi:hypothetical protein